MSHALGRSRHRESSECAPHRTAVARAPATRLLAVATLSLAQAFDFATFHVMVARHGLVAEANPIVRGVYESLGTWGVVAAKVAVVLVVANLFIAAFGQARRTIWVVAGGLPIALAIAAGLIGGITNASSILG